MNLKTTCKIALVITLVSVLLTMAGHVLIYLPALIRHLHFSIIFNAGLGLLASLLKSGGFALFLLALLQRLKNPVANTTPLIALAGILVLLGTLISMGMSMMHIGMLYKHFPFARFLLHAATTGFYAHPDTNQRPFARQTAGGGNTSGHDHSRRADLHQLWYQCGHLSLHRFGGHVVRLSGNPRSRTAVPAGLAKAKTIAKAELPEL
ncbi:MAG: hypothetical protein ACYSOI_04395 [Planctomycetota bacterium]|jgi:hypothetical protein